MNDFGSPRRRILAAACLAAAYFLTACRLSAQSGDWAALRPATTPVATSFKSPRLTESSGVAVSSRHPGVLWSLNDSGNDPVLFATDTTGRDLGAVQVAGARNVDWEDLAMGPCAPGRPARCLYIADTGDNHENRGHATLYRVPEPTAFPAKGTTAPAERLDFKYPDGAQDVEAVYVDGRGDTYLISKGWSGVRLHRLRAAAWGKGVATAESLGPLPIQPAGAVGRLVTGAALAPDGRHVAVRTYRDVFLFTIGENGRLRPAGPRYLDIAGLELQGEGIAWLDGRTLVLTSERAFGQAGTVMVLHCPDALLAEDSTR